jgi:glycosyltransferase involved in cell wall biosynthesis
LAKDPFISIVIPVFNSESSLPLCIKSITNQNYKDYEIILVNDGSTDKSGELCDQYALNHSNIYVLHSKNEGAGNARNKGLNIARGKYIFFVDSDDRIKEKTLHDNALIAETSAPDIIVFGYQKRVHNKGRVSVTESKLPVTKLHSGNMIKDELCKLLDQGIRFSLWNKMFKKSVIDQHELQFPPFRRSQDMAFTLDFFSKAKSMYVHNSIYYVHENQFVSEKYDDSIVVVHLILFKKLFNLFPGWIENNINAIYLAKLFAFWFFLKIPKIMIANNEKAISMKKIQEMTLMKDLESYSTEFTKKRAIPLRFRIPIFLLNKQAYRLIYLFNFILKPMEGPIKKLIR